MFKRDFPIDITRHQLTPFQEQKLEQSIQRNAEVVSTRAITNDVGKRIILVTLTDKFADSNNPYAKSARHELCEDILRKAHSRAGWLKKEKAVQRGMVGHGKKH